MPVKSYGFAIGNLRARENTLLKKSDLAQLTALGSTDSLAATLRDKGFGDRTTQVDVPQLLKKENEQLWDYLYGIAPDKKVFDPFLLENDYHNLKVILKALVRNVDAAPMLLHPVTVVPQIIQNAVREKRFELLPDMMKDAAARGYEILTSSGDAQLCDGVIDKACMQAQLMLVHDRQYHCPLAAEIVSTMVFYNNMKAALRCARSAKNAAFLNETLVETGIIDADRLKNAVLSGTEKVLELLSAAGHGGEQAAAAYEKSPSDFEKFCDDYVMSLARRAKFVTMGVEPVVGYYMARKAEIKNIRIIYSGIKTGQPEQMTTGRLRELYG